MLILIECKDPDKRNPTNQSTKNLFESFSKGSHSLIETKITMKITK